MRVYDTASGRHLVSLLALPGSGAEPRWLALTPQGYVAGQGLQGIARWQAGKQDAPPEAAWKWTKPPGTAG